MGNFLTTYFTTNASHSNNCLSSSLIDHVCGPGTSFRKKRNISGDTVEDGIKRFKLDTPNHVYQRLFIEGANSDVKVHALGHTWQLHRVYLEQCDYFRALLQGNWSDSEKNEYTLDIDDENICYTGLNNVFASLYNNEIEIEEEHIAGVCGAASLLSLTSVLDRCNTHLAEYVNCKDKVLTCIKLAERYGFEQRMNEAFIFLNLKFCHFCNDEIFLRNLRESWLLKLLSIDTVAVRECEFDLYVAIRNWIFLQQHPDGSLGDELAQQRFFHSPKFKRHLHTQLLRHIRVPHIITQTSSLDTLLADGLVSKEFTAKVIEAQWKALLHSEEMAASFNGPIDEKIFNTCCLRLGRTDVLSHSKTSWRWLGYFFGVDLLVSYDFGFIRLTRNCKSTTNQHQISVKPTEIMTLHYRCMVCTDNGRLLLDTQKQNKEFALDKGVVIGAIALPQSEEKLSLHLFYMTSPCTTIPSSFWDQLSALEMQVEDNS